MSNIDKQALREAAERGIKNGDLAVPVVPGLVITLLDELEAAEKRIAELEAKLEVADKLQDSAFRHGLQHGFSYGQTNDQTGYGQCLESYSSRGKDKLRTNP
ncbi:EaD family phage protein [Trabulsiella guamensis ATCC 49490]|uniref:EaD family phage protein n=1 Tax=Trabulsiella guamensis ATCC 49490 TaxID=1005994 RepID=A0A085ADJ5_9ENTR|nr:ead/Ea22-like family protein [Trabulsiella guamensis]KFC08290.1 EaD family phage protein [Trabulsiella guamensis ATCC 49490]